MGLKKHKKGGIRGILADINDGLARQANKSITSMLDAALASISRAGVVMESSLESKISIQTGHFLPLINEFATNVVELGKLVAELKKHSDSIPRRELADGAKFRGADGRMYNVVLVKEDLESYPNY